MTGATIVLGHHRPNPEVQGERARPHLANARRKFCGSLSLFCKELRYLLASSRCSAIVRTVAILLTGLAAKNSRGRTPRGRARLAQQRIAPSRAGLTRPPRRHGVQHFAEPSQSTLERRSMQCAYTWHYKCCAGRWSMYVKRIVASTA